MSGHVGIMLPVGMPCDMCFCTVRPSEIPSKNIRVSTFIFISGIYRLLATRVVVENGSAATLFINYRNPVNLVPHSSPPPNCGALFAVIPGARLTTREMRAIHGQTASQKPEPAIVSSSVPSCKCQLGKNSQDAGCLPGFLQVSQQCFDISA